MVGFGRPSRAFHVGWSEQSTTSQWWDLKSKLVAQENLAKKQEVGDLVHRERMVLISACGEFRMFTGTII